MKDWQEALEMLQNPPKQDQNKTLNSRNLINTFQLIQEMYQEDQAQPRKKYRGAAFMVKKLPWVLIHIPFDVSGCILEAAPVVDASIDSTRRLGPIFPLHGTLPLLMRKMKK